MSKRKNRRVAQSAASLQAAATCSTRLSLPADELQPSANPSVGGRGMSSSPAAGLTCMYSGQAGSVHYRMNCRNEQADTEAEIRGELVPRLAGESYLATDNGPVLLNPVGNGSGTNRAALGWFTSTTSATSTTTWPSQAAEAVEAAAGPEKFPAISPSSNWSTSRGSSWNEKGGDADGRQRTERWNRLKLRTSPLHTQHPAAGKILRIYQVENSVGELNKLLLARMDAGVAYLKLTEPPELLD